MRTPKYIIALAAKVVAMPSCTNTADIEGSIGQENTIKAKNESVPWTGTLVQNGGTTVLWDTSEEIKVFYKSIGSRFVSTNTSASATADFTGTLNMAFGVNDGAGNPERFRWQHHHYPHCSEWWNIPDRSMVLHNRTSRQSVEGLQAHFQHRDGDSGKAVLHTRQYSTRSVRLHH